MHNHEAPSRSSREAYAAALEVPPNERERLNRRKEQLLAKIEKFAERGPGVIEALSATFDALVLRADLDITKDNRQQRVEDVVTAAHTEAMTIEERHRVLQMNAVEAARELEAFEHEHLGRGTVQEDEPAA